MLVSSFHLLLAKGWETTRAGSTPKKFDWWFPPSQPHISLLSLGPEAGGFVEILLRALEIAFSFARVTPVFEEFGEVWIEADGFVVISQRAVYVALGTRTKPRLSRGRRRPA